MRPIQTLLFLTLLLSAAAASGQDADVYFRPFFSMGNGQARFSGRGTAGNVHPLTVPGYGFEVGFSVGRRLHLFTGLTLLQTGYELRDYPLLDPEDHTRPPDTGNFAVRFRQLAPVLGLRYHQPLGRRFFLGAQVGVAPGRITEIVVAPDFPEEGRAIRSPVDPSDYPDLALLGMAKADIGCRLGKSFFLSIGPSFTYTLSNLRHTNILKTERHQIAGIDLGLGFMF